MKLSGDGARFSSSSSFLLLSFSLPGTASKVLSGAGKLSNVSFKILLTDDPSFSLMRLGNHTFAAVRGTESYSRLQSLAVVLEEMNSLIADPYIDVEGRRWQLHILLGGDYKVCIRLALILLSHRSLYFCFYL